MAQSSTKAHESQEHNDDGNNNNSMRYYDSLWSTLNVVVLAVLVHVLYRICWEAYDIRTYAIQEFGRVIHEFDPYFNYRATEYLYEHGWHAFSTWFDYMVWYPLGRPVGTTIYPGMQVTAVFLKNHVLLSMSINDICVFIPAWFGVTATLAVAWLTYNCTVDNNNNKQNFGCVLTDIPGVDQIYKYILKPLTELALTVLQKLLGTTCGLRVRRPHALVPVFSAVAAAGIMSIVPAHLLRSVGGGYDNESIAMTAMVVTFAFWTLSLFDFSLGSADSNIKKYYWKTVVASVGTGLAYFYMVAAWGGYVFVLNVIGVHAGVLVLLGRYSTKLYLAYSIFYTVGTACAIQVPVVGWTPLKSLEQLGPFCVFGGLQLIGACEIVKRRRRLTTAQTWKLRVAVFVSAGMVAAMVVAWLAPTGYFGPISSRVRGLFVKHTKTGNPLVDSVAEHQAASKQAYIQYLHELVYLAPVAFAVTALFFFNDSSSFLIVYGITAYFFSHRMVRLILLTAPIASALGGIFFGRLAGWMLSGVLDLYEYLQMESSSESSSSSKNAVTNGADDSKKNGDDGMTQGSESSRGKKGKSAKVSSKKKKAESVVEEEKKSVTATAVDTKKNSHPLRPVVLLIRLALSCYLILQALPHMKSFHGKAHEVARQISHPTIITKARTKSGETVLVDDYRDAYYWLRDNTPADARIMAWWDYGYQITGIANRTTIADGNTWNHEHIALLGRILTSPEKQSHRIARHLADYVLIWAGGGGDDLAKSPHLRRIANSVYRGLCREPTCRDFGFHSTQAGRTPTKDVEESLLYKLHSHRLVPGVEADPNRFREVYNSKYGKVRIYKINSVSKESKEWVENNRICDAPGSWFCRGQYPPALQKILKEKKDFKQLEDFNQAGGDDSEYQREYFENLLGEKRGPSEKNDPSKKRRKSPKLSPAEIDLINEDWENNEMTSLLYNLIAEDKTAELKEVLISNPQLAHVRSEDGRGPMFWAHEKGRKKMIEMLKKLDVSESRTDANGRTPLDP